MYNEIYSNNDETKVSDRLLKGIDKVANPVKSTFGPCGKNVIIKTNYAGTIATKDGVTVAKSITLQDEVENIAATMIKEVASKAVSEAGDGTTTSTILAQALYHNGLKYASDIQNKNLLRKEIEDLCKSIVENIKLKAQPIQFNENNTSEIFNIAKISSNGDIEMANAIVEAFKTVGIEGVITVDEGYGDGYSIEKVDGLKVNASMAHPYFMTDERKAVSEQENTNVLIVKDGILSLQPYKTVLENLINSGKPITIFSDSFSDSTLQVAVANKLRGINLTLIKIQGYGVNKDATFEDIAALTGATIIDKNIKEAEYLNCVGTATKIISNKNETQIIGEKDSIKFVEHIDKLKIKLEDTSNTTDLTKLSERIAKLVGGVAIIIVKGKSDKEIHEKKDRVDDAVSAVRSAIEEGYVPGSSVTLLKAALDLNWDSSIAAKIMRESLQAPLKTLCENAGYSYEFVKSMIINSNDIYNGKNIVYGVDFSVNTDMPITIDLLNAGIIDPVKVLRVALESAVSITNLLLTSDNVITTINDDKQE